MSTSSIERLGTRRTIAILLVLVCAAAAMLFAVFSGRSGSPGAEAGPTSTPTQAAPEAAGAGPYGARGAWPEGAPSADKAPAATVSSLDALTSVLRSARGGDVVHLRGFTSPDTFELDDPEAARNLASLSSPVLVRSAPGQHFVQQGNLGINVPNLHLALFEQRGVIHFRVGSTGSALARVKVTDGGKLFLHGAGKIQLVEWLRPERGTGRDTIQVKAGKNSAGRDVVPSDLTILSSWIEGQTADVSNGDHSDTIQFLGITGRFIVRNTYIGTCGNSAVIQSGREDHSGTYARFDFDTVFMSGCQQYGNGSVFEQFDQGAIYRNVTWEHVKSRLQADDGRVLPETVQNNTFAEQEAWKLEDGTVASKKYPGNTWNASVKRPTFTPPSWWW